MSKILGIVTVFALMSSGALAETNGTAKGNTPKPAPTVGGPAMPKSAPTVGGPSKSVPPATDTAAPSTNPSSTAPNTAKASGGNAPQH